MIANLLFEEEWFRPISANDLIIGSLDMLLSLRLSCWCRCLTRRASLTCSPNTFLVRICIHKYIIRDIYIGRWLIYLRVIFYSTRLSFLVPFLSTRPAMSLYWSYCREPNQQSVQDCSLPCPTSQFHLTAGSSVRRGRVAKESLRVVCSIYFHPPRHLLQIWSTYG